MRPTSRQRWPPGLRGARQGRVTCCKFHLNPYTAVVPIWAQRPTQHCRFSARDSAEVRRAPAAHTSFDSSRRELSAATFTTSGGQVQGVYGAAEARPRFPQVAPAAGSLRLSL